MREINNMDIYQLIEFTKRFESDLINIKNTIHETFNVIEKIRNDNIDQVERVLRHNLERIKLEENHE